MRKILKNFEQTTRRNKENNKAMEEYKQKFLADIEAKSRKKRKNNEVK